MKTMTITSRRMSAFRLRSVLSKAVTLTGLLAALLPPVFADDIADVNRLVRAGQYAEALSKVDAFLSKNPRDAQMRFLKGVILTEQNKSADAIAIFTRLTEDYPALPEPHNNLAVLYAAGGQYDKARVALDAAIRTNPAYATAYENLGDVHAKLASQAYDKALQLDSGNAGAKSKLTLVRSLTGNMNTGTNAKTSLSAAAPDSLPKVAAVAPPSKPTLAPSAPPAVPSAVASAKPVAPLATAKPEPTKPEPKAASNANAERDEVLATVHNWAKAWSAQDVKTYLNFYGADFQTPGGQTRKAWEEDRRARIAGKGRISVKVDSPQVALNGSTATVKFRQIYVSDRLTANSRKTLVLARNGGKWQIRQEQTGS